MTGIAVAESDRFNRIVVPHGVTTDMTNVNTREAAVVRAKDALVTALGRPEFVGVDPRASLQLVDVLEDWSRGQAADVLHLVFAIALGVGTATLVPALLVGRRAAPQASERDPGLTAPAPR